MRALLRNALRVLADQFPIPRRGLRAGVLGAHADSQLGWGEIRLGRDAGPFFALYSTLHGVVFAILCLAPQSLWMCCAGADGESTQLQPTMLLGVKDVFHIGLLGSHPEHRGRRRYDPP